MKDPQLEQLIENDLLRDDRVSSQSVSVMVNNGVVTLQGTVQSFRRKLTAQQIVGAYDGVRDVDNQLSVNPSNSGPDHDIADSVRAALNSSADIQKETIAVDVSGGKVTLSGNVASNWERIVADDICRGVRGVRDVTNMLMVDAAHKKDDYEVVREVQAALERARGLKGVAINCAIGEDTVVLSGQVDEIWKKEVAQTVVGRFGFLHIRNEIQVGEHQ